MTQANKPLGERQIAEVFRSLADEYAELRIASDRRRAEQRIQRPQLMLDAPEPARSRFRISLRRLLPAVAAAATFAWVLSLWLLPPSLLEYSVEGASIERGVLRTLDRPASIRFSDESAILAAPSTTLQLDVVGERAALARLVKGNLDVAVHHAENTDWRFLAGPYEVRVIGTRFALAWDPEQAALSLVMKEGKVRVVGPDALDRMLVAGQRLDLSRNPAPVAVATAPEPAGVPEAPPRRTAAASREDSPPPTSIAPVSRSWSSLVAAGRFEQVVREAQTEGIARAHAERPAPELRALAQAAAYTGRTDLAIKTWTVVRARFTGRSAEQAAFFLGRIFDQSGRHSEALNWLRTYLREAPRGVYASEALGGVLTLVRRTEGPTAAQPLARNYLERFPKGSYAAAARAVLDGQ